MSESIPNDEELKRRILFTPLSTKEDLHNWIKVFLGISLPDSIVATEGPNPSNCTVLDMIWRLYDICLNNKDPNIDRIMAYASRDSGKTLGAAIFEVLAILHLRRNVVHLAAIERQSFRCQKYVREFFNRDPLVKFKKGENKTDFNIIHYEHKVTKQNLTEREWNELLTDQEKSKYERISNTIEIVVCTMQSTNGAHSEIIVLDEIEVVSDPRAYEQAKFIPAPRDGKLPLTLLTSTRKSNSGLVQKELDEAEKSGLIVWHWNIIDVTEPCPVERHRPDLPKIPIYRSDETLKAINEVEYEALPSEFQKLYEKDVSYSGCLTNCKLFASCRGKLATLQKSDSPLLRPISNTQNRFRSSSDGLVKAEMLCWKPSTEGLVYPRLNKDIHLITAAEMAEKLTGEKYPDSYTKEQFYQLISTREAKWYAGMDFGYTHNFAIVMGVKDGNRMFITHHFAIPELDDAQKLEFCNKTIKTFNPVIFPDPESPSTIKTFKRAGYLMREWKKGKGSVIGGIEIVRMKLMPVIGEPQLYFLRGDQNVESLVTQLEKYHWKLDAAGRPTDEPTDKDDDSADALRYVVMNIFSPRGKVTVTKDDPTMTSIIKEKTKDNWMQSIISEKIGDVSDLSDMPVPKGKRGGFHWDI